MFFKKDPLKKLKKEYATCLNDAMQLQRNGKIPEYAKKTAEANKLLEKIEELEKAQV